MFSKIKRLDIEKIQIDPSFENCRGETGNVDELKASILKDGLINPLVVRKNGKNYLLRAGFRRHKAITELIGAGAEGFNEVDIRVLEGEESEDKFINLIENVHQRTLPVTRAAKIVSGLYKSGLKESEIAKNLGMSVSWVSQRIALANRLIPELSLCIEGNYITLTEALKLASLSAEDQKSRLSELLDSEEANQQVRDSLKGKRPGIRELRATHKEVLEYDREEDADYRAGVIQGVLYSLGLVHEKDSLFHPPETE